MLPKYRILLLLVLKLHFAIAQNVNFEWVNTFQGKLQNEVIGNHIATDSKGNVYTAGIYKKTVNFAAPNGNHKFTANNDTDIFGKANIYDLFIVKHNSNGNFLWAKTIGGPGTENLSSLAIDAFDNIFLSGKFQDSMDFDPNPTKYFINAGKNGLGFLLKLDTGGTFIWAKSYPYYFRIKIDKDNNIIGMDKNYSKMDIDPGHDSLILKQEGVFTMKLKNNGDFIWGKHFEGYGITFGEFALDSIGNIYACGNFGTSPVDFDPGSGLNIMKTSSGFQVYITKLDPSGNFIWAKSVGGQSDNNYTQNDIDVDNQGNCYVTGYYESSRDFDPGMNTYNLPGRPYDNPFSAEKFILKLNTKGDFVWVKRIDPGHSVVSMPIKCDKKGGIYIGGNFTGIMDFDLGLGTSIIPSTQGFEKIAGNYYSKDGFLLKLNEWGNFVWAKKIGGPDFDLIHRLNINNKSEIICLGIFADTLSYFWKNRDSINFNPDGSRGRVFGCGNFVLKYSQTTCSNLTLIVDTVKDVSCTAGFGYISTKTIGGKLPYTYAWNTTPVVKKSKNTFSSRGQYTITVMDSLGCKNASTVVLEGPLFLHGFDVAGYLTAGTLRPGHNSRIVITAVNEGCTILNGNVRLKLDTNLTFVSASPAPDSIQNNVYTWKSSLISSDSKPFEVELIVMPKTHLKMGDSVDLNLTVSPFKDSNPFNNNKSYRYRIVNSYDPNNKLVYPAGECKNKYVLKNKPLTYTINFQNTGTAEAINVYVIDTISSYLNINSVRVIAQSHPQLITETFNNKWIRFKFDNINLPDSNANEKASHGYIIYEIYPDSNLLNENLVTGNAGIFFDFNEPVFTNNVSSTLTKVIPACPAKVGIKTILKRSENTLFPNPSSGILYLSLNKRSLVQIFSVQGKLLHSENLDNGTTMLNISNFPAGVYIVETGSETFRLIKVN